MEEEEELSTVSYRVHRAEHYSNGQLPYEVKVLQNSNGEFLCWQCNFPMKLLNPFSHFCFSCGNLLVEIPKNPHSQFYASTIKQPLFVITHDMQLNQKVNHEVTLKQQPKRIHKKTWLEKDKQGKRVQVEEATEEAIEE